VTYHVKEMFYTLQGEGCRAGRASVFLRFTGCNLWSGLERDRENALCNFCDTDFVGTDGEGGGRFESPESLARAVRKIWQDAQRGAHDQGSVIPYVVCTGGEPLLQLDRPLITALHDEKFEIALETNGSIAAPDGIDWVCVSPKGEVPIVQLTGHELKLVYPQKNALPEKFEHLKFEYFLLQPMDGVDVKNNTNSAVQYCLSHPKWRLSLQTHKWLGIP
jgi:7-carboxy-7-deazaguanine synthase (Cx14CxxC type)